MGQADQLICYSLPIEFRIPEIQKMEECRSS